MAKQNCLRTGRAFHVCLRSDGLSACTAPRHILSYFEYCGYRIENVDISINSEVPIFRYIVWYDIKRVLPSIPCITVFLMQVLTESFGARHQISKLPRIFTLFIDIATNIHVVYYRYRIHYLRCLSISYRMFTMFIDIVSNICVVYRYHIEHLRCLPSIPYPIFTLFIDIVSNIHVVYRYRIELPYFIFYLDSTLFRFPPPFLDVSPGHVWFLPVVGFSAVSFGLCDVFSGRYQFCRLTVGVC